MFDYVFLLKSLNVKVVKIDIEIVGSILENVVQKKFDLWGLNIFCI